jgi:aspartyl/asparaginyl beta-hydroxylase (cupin superfamily)
MTLEEKSQFLKNIQDNFQNILDEYLKNKHKRTIPVPDWSSGAKPLAEWRAIALWWDYEPSPIYQKLFPFTTELLRNGPTHRATGWLILKPHSRTPLHNHIDWGRKIILHLPMIIPEGDVGFWVGGKLHRWVPGELFAFDISKDHYGFNNTDEERAMLVLDFDADEWGEALKPYMRLEYETV